MKSKMVMFLFLFSGLNIALAEELPTLNNCKANVKIKMQMYNAPPHGPLNLMVEPRTGVKILTTERIMITQTKLYGSFNGYKAWYEVVNSSGSKWAWIDGGNISDLDHSNLTNITCDK